MGNIAIRQIPVAAEPRRGYIGDLDWTLNWRDNNPDHLYMAMKGYFDESGTHGAQSPTVIVAGFIGTVDQWAKADLPEAQPPTEATAAETREASHA